MVCIRKFQFQYKILNIVRDEAITTCAAASSNEATTYRRHCEKKMTILAISSFDVCYIAGDIKEWNIHWTDHLDVRVLVTNTLYYFVSMA